MTILDCPFLGNCRTQFNILYYLMIIYGYPSLIAQLVKNLPAVLETPVRFLGQEDPLEKG